MAVSAADFKAEFAEFASLSDETIEAKLAAAYRRAGPALGDLQDEAAKNLAAHMLAISPLSEPSARTAGQGGGTEYLDEYNRIIQAARAGLFCGGSAWSGVIPGADEAD